MPDFVVEVRKRIHVTAYTAYEAVGRVLRDYDFDESDIHSVGEMVPQPAFLEARVVDSAWREARDDEGNGLGYPELEKEARRDQR